MKRIKLILLLSLILFSANIFAQINSPSELRARMDNSHTVRLDWRDNSSNELGFYVERAEVLGLKNSWEIIAEIDANEDRYYDYWIEPNKKYYYRIFAFGENNVRSDYSNIDSVTTPNDTNGIPAAPTDLEVTSVQDSSIRMNWIDHANNEMGFMIARRAEDEIYFSIIDTVGTDVLTYQEVGLRPNTLYYYKVCSYNEYGISAYSNIVSARTKESMVSVNFNAEVPEEFFLGYNYPNPFNPSTTIEFGIAKPGIVNLVVYNSAGQSVHELIRKEFLHAGTYSVIFQPENFSSGVYFYRIESGIFSDIKKMILIK